MENKQKVNRKKAPSANLYTRSEAIQKLGLPKSTFHDYVTAGRIQKVVPPGKREGYYLKKEIDELANATHLFILQYTSEPTVFSLAKEEDIEGIYQVVESLWGKAVTTPTELRKSWYKVNPLMDYVVKQEDIVVGFVNIKPLTHEAIQKYINREIQVKDLQPNDILPFTPGIALECEADIAVRAGVQKPEKYGMRLIGGIINVMRQFAKEGIIIKAIYTRSSTSDGIRLANGLGFKTVNSDVEQNSKLFILDFETSDSPFAQEYNQIRAETR